MSTSLYSPQTRYQARLTRDFPATGTGTIYFSSDKDLGITAGFFDLDAENSKAETVLITGITGSATEYSGTVSVRGLREYGSNTNVSGNQYAHRATSKMIISDSHQWIYQIISAFNTHEDLVGAFHGFAGIGTLASRPAASGNSNKLYFATDTQALYVSDGSSWAAAPLGSSPNAGASTIGVTKLSTAPADSANPIAVGDNDTRLTSSANMTDLTDGGDSTLHYHASDRARANHTGTQALSTILETGTAGETLAADNLVYLKSSDNKLYKATQDISSDANAWDVIGIIVTGGSANASVTFRPLIGTITVSSPLAANTEYYLGVSGALTTTRPSYSSSTVVPLKIGKTDATGRLNCKVQRIPRVITASFSGTSNQTITVGFEFSLAQVFIGMYDIIGLVYTGAGYFNALTNTQACPTDGGISTSYCAYAGKSGAAGFRYVASVSGSDLLLTYSNTGSGPTNPSGVAIVYEAL